MVERPANADDGPSGSQFIALRTRVPVEVVRPRTQAPRQRFSPGPVRNWAVGGRDLLQELNMWVRSLPDRPMQVQRELALILYSSYNMILFPPP